MALFNMKGVNPAVAHEVRRSKLGGTIDRHWTSLSDDIDCCYSKDIEIDS